MGLRNFSIIRNQPSLGVCEALDLGIGGGLGLVAEYDVRVREDGHHLILEELDEEGGGQVHAVRLVLLSTLLARLKQSLVYFIQGCGSGSVLLFEDGSGSACEKINPDPHLSPNSGVLEAKNGGVEGHGRSKWRRGEDQLGTVEELETGRRRCAL